MNQEWRKVVTLARVYTGWDNSRTTARAVLGRRIKAFTWRKVVTLARVTLPAGVRHITYPSCLASQDEFAFLMYMVGCSLKRNKLNVTSVRVTWGEGCLGYQRPYNCTCTSTCIWRTWELSDQSVYVGIAVYTCVTNNFSVFTLCNKSTVNIIYMHVAAS